MHQQIKINLKKRTLKLNSKINNELNKCQLIISLSQGDSYCMKYVVFISSSNSLPCLGDAGQSCNVHVSNVVKFF